MNHHGWRRLLNVCWPGGELRLLKRELPDAHRLWVPTSRDIRRETDAEYRARLQRLAAERVSSNS